MLSSPRIAEAPILSPSDRTALPTPSQLERTVASLERKGNLRLLICVVEAWDEVGEPTRPALLAQVRALLTLCAVDRAWARIQALLPDPDEVEVYQLAGRVLVDRGQHKEARALLIRARQRFPDDVLLRELLGRTNDPGTVLDLTDPLEDDADGQCKLAERLLLEGAPLRARRLLERVRKLRPDHTRTADLLWALDGEFQLRGVTLADLARVHAAIPTLGEHEVEHTETLGKRPPLADEPDSLRSFAGLFKNLDGPTDAGGPADDEPELTQLSSMDGPTEVTDGRELTTSGPEDTQIMHVVRHVADKDPAVGDTLVDRAFDLRAGGPAGLEGEGEDEHVVERRRGVGAPEHAPPPAPSEERIRLDPSRERVQHGVNAADEGAEFVRPRKRPEILVEEAPTAPAPAPTPSTPRPVNRSAEPARPRLAAAPEAKARPRGVALEKRTPVGPRRVKLDPALAAAPTVVLDDEPTPTRSSFAALAPWTGWLLMLAFLGLLAVSLGGMLVAWQVFELMR